MLVVDAFYKRRHLLDPGLKRVSRGITCAARLIGELPYKYGRVVFVRDPGKRVYPR